jgi:hypothetical protein
VPSSRSAFEPSIALQHAALVAALLTAIWSTAGPFDNPDPRIRLRVAAQLVAEHRLVVAAPDTAGATRFQDAAGSYPSRFGIGQSLFFVPFVAIARPLTGAVAVPPPLRPKLMESVVATAVYAVVLVVTFALSVALARALGAGSFVAHVIGVLAVFGSSYWQMAKEGQEEAQLAIAAQLAFYGYLKWRRSGHLGYVWLSAGAATAATIFRPTAVTLFVGALGLYLVALLRARHAGTLGPGDSARVAACFAVTGACGLALILGYNMYKAGDPLRSGYGRADGWFAQQRWLYALRGATLGTDRGIVWQNIWLIPLALAAILEWRRLSDDVRDAIVLAGFLLGSSLAFYSMWIGWSGGQYSYGTRFQQHAVPLLAVALAMGAFGAGRGGPGSARRLMVPALILLCVLQLPSIAFVHGLEGLQAKVSGARGGLGAEPTAGRGGQLRTRYENLVSKLTTGRLPAVDTLPEQRGLVPLLVDSSRWNLWPWRLEKYFGARAASAAKVVWVVLALASLAFWAVGLVAASRAADPP